MTVETLAFDEALRKEYPMIAGCDEVGRGCLAGPVVTAAVILPPNTDIVGVMDSKKIPKDKHEDLARQIFDVAIEVQMGIKSPEEVDELNILQATKQAMRDSVNNLNNKPDLLLIDGNDKQLLGTEYAEQTVIKGDHHSLTIGAASVIAKYVRDQIMQNADKDYPGYGFSTNAGYGTAKHLSALSELGITPLHRKTFKPIVQNIGVWKTNDIATRTTNQ